MWPGLGDDDRQAYALNITKNIEAAANWDHPRWGFDAYITLTCDDPFNACNGKIGDDPRSVACYVNNTMELWGSVSCISCCGAFFTINDNKQAFDYGKAKDITQLGLDWMRTSGSYLVHEMMHTVKITQDRPHIMDQSFPGALKRRVYGPKDCAKAARGNSGLGITENTLNADSYAEFMLAMYWKDLFNGQLLPPTSTLSVTEAPPGVNQSTGDFELVSDNDDSYVDFAAQVTQPQLTCAGEPADKPPATQAWIAAQINDYCTQIANSGWIVNSTLGQYGPKGYVAGNTAPDSENDLWLSVSHDPGCDVNTAYEVELSDCQEFFGIALNGCNTNSLTRKWGGQVQANCALWNITTRAGHNTMPPNGYPPK
ncbi:hypothetical protein, variant [Cladophialophora immunda]|nr:hypothetical protein, variant [Cladophialophora immunda]KIW24839.1 hypothetical protein, variant [Cladophialophora immunda]